MGGTSICPVFPWDARIFGVTLCHFSHLSRTLSTPQGTCDATTMDSSGDLSAFEDNVDHWVELQYCPDDDITIVSGDNSVHSFDHAGGDRVMNSTPPRRICTTNAVTSPTSVRSGLENAYIKQQWSQRGLKLLQKVMVYKAWTDHSYLGLVKLFIRNSFFDAMRTWTNSALSRKGESNVTATEFDAFLGLEIGMSLVGFNRIADYWSGVWFRGMALYNATMGRTRFQIIRANLQVHPPDQSSSDPPHDPMWFIHEMMSHFQKNCFEVAVPRGPCSLDENGQPSKGRCRGTSYNPSKPDPHAFRYFALTGHEPNYLHTIFYNGAGCSDSSSQSSR